MTYEEAYQPEPRHFNEWWSEQFAGGAKAEERQLACLAWNKALNLAAERFGELEGTSFGVERIFQAEDLPVITMSVGTTDTPGPLDGIPETDIITLPFEQRP